ncbi:hypothetical protein FB45DRAFT_801282 [Roridomyces roridus]|uniref:F-box domain-containing protein n=1 Tax=Roridomyces roridus TaxID=1738132 RepID=A0AAD7FCU7_9AGAR|nr:hypothetical protein FB45DRAFT_801282 [Roridomyces roridus]
MDPDLVAIVKSNKAPNDIQARQIRVLLPSYVAEISDLDSEIAATTALLRDMEERRNVRSKFLAGLQSALAPIRTVPNEIFAEIFLLCRDGALDPHDYSLFDSKQPPLLLAHVSSQWRAVCFSDARLWDHIHIHSVERMPPMATLRAIFTRSRLRPLDIHITESPLGDLFRVILAAHTRVRRICLRVNSSDDVSDLWSYPRDFPSLTTFELHIQQQEATSLERPVGLGLFKTAPLLRSFLIWSYPSPFDPRPGAVVWSQLTELTLDIGMDELTALSIIVACTRLQDCRIFLHSSSQFTPLLMPPSHATTLPQLWCLRVFGRAPRVGLPFFEGLTLPALTELLLCIDELSPEALPNLYNRSSFRLKNLQIWDFIPHDLTGLLQLTPSLEELSLQFVTLNDEVFEMFTYRPASPTPVVLPKLRSLVLWDAGDELTTDGVSAAEMGESFTRYSLEGNLAFPSLRKVELILGGHLFDDDVEDRLVAASGGIFAYERFTKS